MENRKFASQLLRCLNKPTADGGGGGGGEVWENVAFTGGELSNGVTSNIMASKSIEADFVRITTKHEIKTTENQLIVSYAKSIIFKKTGLSSISAFDVGNDTYVVKNIIFDTSDKRLIAIYNEVLSTANSETLTITKIEMLKE